MDITPTTRTPTDPMQPQPQIFGDTGGPTHGVQVDPPSIGDRANSFTQRIDIKPGDRVFQSARIGPEQRSQYGTKAVIRPDLGPGPPLPARTAATRLGSQRQPQLGVPAES